ncbi:hypothetical protein [uncultured Brachyspira sp.]|uniref:carboxymuconolactone decarboxylase family protein n=1 Tax=uncultured Brachyspira sp. TaxID=221953 RepID=UPI0025EC5EA1|nr:hypothetical protein [uncultured Brachyspira sp.]
MARVKFVEYEEAQGKVKEAFDYHLKKSGNVTNMKKALLNDYITYDTMMGWYTSYSRLVEVVGERAAMILAHSVSTTNGCILCSLFFIRDLKAIGDDPKNLKLDEKEELLSQLGMQMVKDPNGVTDELMNNLKKHFNDSEIVVIVGFISWMIAYNTFNSVLDIDLDESLVGIAGEFEKETWRKK